LQPLDGKAYRRFYHFSESSENLIDNLIQRLERVENRSVYISREAEEANLFLNQCNSFGFKTHAQAALVAETTEVNHMPFTEWVFFSSRNCVKHFFEQELMVPEVAAVAAMGSGTAEELKKHGISVSLEGEDGKTEETAARFLAQVKGKSVLFPIGNSSLRTVQKALEKEVECHDILVYEQKANPEFKTIDAHIYVFTSPALFEAYPDKSQLKNAQLIAIGETTAQSIRNAGFKNVHVARSTNEQALADLVCGLL
jgi:uroporphyrinogen-III synthase